MYPSEGMGVGSLPDLCSTTNNLVNACFTDSIFLFYKKIFTFCRHPLVCEEVGSGRLIRKMPGIALNIAAKTQGEVVGGGKLISLLQESSVLQLETRNLILGVCSGRSSLQGFTDKF